jgi:tetratricopeptide (TPR) repeat protein
MMADNGFAIRLCTLAIGLMAAGAAVAQDKGGATPQSAGAREYAACMRLARTDPKAARESALAWRKTGGGPAALHCIAVSLLGLGEYARSAKMLEELAEATDKARPDLRSGLLAQAANVRLIAGQAGAAEKLLGRALRFQPNNPDTLIDRSIAFAALGRYWEALDDLNQALDIVPDRTEALVFRASAWRKVGAIDLAAQDIDSALAIRPDNLDALLERGIIHKMKGDAARARADWLKVIERAVDGPLREAARHNLENMDVRKP